MQPLVLELDPAGGGGFVRAWPAYEDSWIQRHHGYALQWFSLALVLLVVYLLSQRSRRPGDPS